MFRTLLSVVALWALLPATLCEAACTLEPVADSSHAMPVSEAPMPCHGAPSQPAPAAPEHDADECPGCQLDLVAAATPAQAGLHVGTANASLPAAPVQPFAAVSRSAHSAREPPGLRHDPFARRNAPLLN